MQLIFSSSLYFVVKFVQFGRDASSVTRTTIGVVRFFLLHISPSLSSPKANYCLVMISTKTDEVLGEALMRVAAAGNNKDEVVVHLVTGERCYTAFATPVSPKRQDITPDCVDMMPSTDQEIQVHPEPVLEPALLNNPVALRPNFSLPSVVIHGASSNNDITGPSIMSPKTKKKKKKSSKEDASNSSSASRSPSFHVRSACPIPLLKLPDDHDEDGGSNPPPIHIEAATSDEGENVECDDAKVISKKRRKSLVHLLFSSSSKNVEACHNSLDAGMTPHGGQRLHFRRLSEIICRLGGSSNKEEEHQPLTKQTSKDDSELGSMESPSAGLTLRQLFPYRRRRSSVSHLDNTAEFKETKEEYLISARRRMSSFPPSDGDESAIVLEKIHSMGKIEIGVPDTPTSNTEGCVTPTSTSSPFKLLRRGPGGLFPASKSKKAKWKSSTDIPAAFGSSITPTSNNNNNNNNSDNSNSNSISNISNVSCNPTSDSSQVKASPSSAKEPSSNKRTGWGQSSSSSSFLRPSFPLMSRRGSSPLESELVSFLFSNKTMKNLNLNEKLSEPSEIIHK